MKVLMIDRKINAYVKNKQKWRIINELKKKISIEDSWILVDPDIREKNVESLKFNYKNFEDYKTKNLIKILEQENPDVIIISNDYDFFVRAFIPAAKFLKIPIIMLLLSNAPAEYLGKMDLTMLKGKILVHGSRKTSILRKFFFLLKTLKQTNHSYFEILGLIRKEVMVPFLQYHPWGEGDCDLVLVAGDDWKKYLQLKKIKSKIIVTGWPLLDEIYDKVQKFKIKVNTEKTKLKIVLMTAPMIEHGLWTKNEWEHTIKAIINEVQTKFDNEIEFIIKIHPTSEVKKQYEEFLKRINVQIPVYQKEDLMEIIKDADFVLTYAQSTGIIEAACMGKPVIVINLFNYPEEKMPFLKAGLATELKNISKLKEVIDEISMEDVRINLDKYITKYLYAFDGRSSERVADAIIRFTQKYKK